MISFYDKVGEKIGWNFSKIEKNLSIEDKKWVFLEIIKSYLKEDYFVLDLGSGGGEKTLKLADHCKKIVGIDSSSGMINKSIENLNKTRKKNVEFFQADINNLNFPEKSFDLVICRHSPFNTKEISRVLKEGGFFITQQVGEEDKINIKKIFGRGQYFGERTGTMINKMINQLIHYHFKIIKKDYYNATEYYKDIRDILFLLQHTPIIPNFNLEKDKEKITELEKENKTEKGIKTNSERYLIVAQKKFFS